MRYRKEHKAETRKRVVDAAARRLRRDGIAATGVVDLMADAGLTHGGFYAHFPSKDSLVREALLSSWAQNRNDLQREIDNAQARKRDPLDGLARLQADRLVLDQQFDAVRASEYYSPAAHHLYGRPLFLS